MNPQVNDIVSQLRQRRALLIKTRGEPVMDDFDSGFRAAAWEEISFLDKILNQYGSTEEREDTSST